MKKQLSIVAFSFFMLAAAPAVSAQGNSGKKDEKQNGNSKNDKAQKKEQSPNSAVVPGAGNNNQNKGKGNQGQDNKGNNANNGKGNSDKNGKGNNGKNDNANNGSNENGNSYKWNRENFKDRDKIKKQEKVSICHKTGDKNDPGVTINVSSNAAKAHMNHGDVMGTCPAVTDNRFSNSFLGRRQVYYTTIEDTREQVTYSRSILDYALERLNASRQQLVVMRANNVPAAEIQKKEVVVTELQQNVSLLETLVGVAATLLVNKLSN